MVLLSGTPIINQPYEISFLINLLRGPMVTHNIPILHGTTNKKNLVFETKSGQVKITPNGEIL